MGGSDGCRGRRRPLSAGKGQGKMNFGQGKVREKSGNFIPDEGWAP